MTTVQQSQNQTSPICPFCHDAVKSDSVAKQAVVCRNCFAPTHNECWNEHGKCPSCGSTNAVGKSTPQEQTSTESNQQIRPKLEVETGAARLFLIPQLDQLGVDKFAKRIKSSSEFNDDDFDSRIIALIAKSKVAISEEIRRENLNHIFGYSGLIGIALFCVVGAHWYGLVDSHLGIKPYVWMALLIFATIFVVYWTIQSNLAIYTKMQLSLDEGAPIVSFARILHTNKSLQTWNWTPLPDHEMPKIKTVHCSTVQIESWQYDEETGNYVPNGPKTEKMHLIEPDIMPGPGDFLCIYQSGLFVVGFDIFRVKR